MVVATVAMLAPQVALAQQKGEYRQSQTRMLEPMQQVFVRPLVVDLRVVSPTKVSDTWVIPAKVDQITLAAISDAKIMALYQSNQKHESDVMVAPTFDIRTVKEGLQITVTGFPAVYENWQIARAESDYEWIEDVYGTSIRSNDATQSVQVGINRVRSYAEE